MPRGGLRRVAPRWRCRMTTQIAIFDLDSALLRSSPLPVLADSVTDVDPIGGTIAGALQGLYRAFDPVSGPLLTHVGLRAALARFKGRDEQLEAAGRQAAPRLA